ncbi:SpoIID/LytB domain-containing protein [Nocardioides ungokensis]|uniref:SpoIID/LytB domain-containing protein n=1 Tax=Nocardioides ungokensis TaxID=1643322 RepID=UPI0015DECEEE|nr:SpoIID/LytB domain-containing protein [Nocardioides ungokensis]
MKRSSTVLALAATVAATLVGSSPASADTPYTVPTPATITITGDGYGHGKGMSQYGAYGAARQGLTFKQIVSFYYPGTALGETGGQVKVLISADDDRDLVVDAARGLTVRALASGRSWKPDVPRASRWRILPSGSRTQISYRTSGWHSGRTVRGDVQLSAGSRPLTLRTPDGPVAYRGALRSTFHKDTRVTVNVVPMESYVRGVVPSEMYASWPQQALRAQAVASRTYAAYEREHTSNTAYDLCDTAACQAYGGYTGEAASSDDAVAATARRIVTYQGATAFAQFSASNGGWTVAGQFPYLPAQQDPYEGTSKDYYGWTVTLTDADIEKAFNLENLTSIGIETRDGNDRDDSRDGRVETVRLVSSGGFDGTVSGEKFRSKFGMRSTLFSIDRVE